MAIGRPEEEDRTEVLELLFEAREEATEILGRSIDDMEEGLGLRFKFMEAAVEGSRVRFLCNSMLTSMDMLRTNNRRRSCHFDEGFHHHHQDKA